MIRKGQRFSHSYADACRGYVLNHLQPFFGTMRLQDIGVPAIEDFIVHMQKQQYSSSTINDAFSALSIILNEAVRQGLLEKNPAKHVKCVAKRSAEKDLIPLNTAHELFDYRNLDLYWNGSFFHYLFNLIAFTTGLRPKHSLQPDVMRLDHCLKTLPPG